MAKKRYTLEFKQEAIKLITEQGYTLSETSKRLGVPHANLSRWVKEYHNSGLTGTPSKKPKTAEQQELEALRKEVKRLKMEREILKKAALSSIGECNKGI